MQKIIMILLLIVNLVVALISFVMISGARSASKRGTNAVTRFVRDTVSYTSYYIPILACTASTIITIVLGLIAGGGTILACIPSVAAIVFAFYSMSQSNNNKTRVKDARVVTKHTSTAVGNGLNLAADIAAPHLVNPYLNEQQIKTVASTVGNSIKVAGNFSDVPDMNLMVQQPTYNYAVVSNEQEFIETANRMGIPTQGKTVEQVAAYIISCAPPHALQVMDPNLSNVEKAQRIMKGAI